MSARSEPDAAPIARGTHVLVAERGLCVVDGIFLAPDERTVPFYAVLGPGPGERCIVRAARVFDVTALLRQRRCAAFSPAGGRA
jgi:hypothetical protein